MASVTVETKEQLKKAVDESIETIIVKGDLAKKVVKARKIKSASKVTLILLATALGAAPFTGGISMFAAAPIAAMTGLEVAVIISLAALGVTLAIYLSNNYDFIEIKEDGVTLKRNNKKD